MLTARMISIGTLRVGKAASVPAPTSLTLDCLVIPTEHPGPDCYHLTRNRGNSLYLLQALRELDAAGSSHQTAPSATQFLQSESWVPVCESERVSVCTPLHSTAAAQQVEKRTKVSDERLCRNEIDD